MQGWSSDVDTRDTNFDQHAVIYIYATSISSSRLPLEDEPATHQRFVDPFAMLSPAYAMAHMDDNSSWLARGPDHAS